MKDALQLAGAIMLILVSILFAFSKADIDVDREARTAIKECERHLPRNQHCEYKITAEVKKDAL